MHLYLHVPFCARRCSYCDFAIAVRRAVPSAEYRTAIAWEWQHRDSGFGNEAIETLYFGGGTPSHLDPAELTQLIATFRQEPGIGDDAEITLEVNPDDVSLEHANAWHRAGINRLSLGVQSHDPAVLAWMHRTHTAEQVPEAMRILRRAGFDNISLDLMFALPDMLHRDWVADLHATVALEPEHVSLYGLTVEPHTPLARWTARGMVVATGEGRYAEEYLQAVELLGAGGYAFYEVSNAARHGRISRHNSAYWTGADYLGLGPSAHSRLGNRRSWNIRDWAEYARRSATGEPLEEGFEVLDARQRLLETRYLGLRTSSGLPLAELPADHGSRWAAAGWGREADGRFRLTPEGWLRLDALVAALGDS